MKWFKRIRKYLFAPYRTEIYGGFKDEAGRDVFTGRSYSRFDDWLEIACRIAFCLLIILLLLAALGLIHTAMQAIR